MFVPTDSTTNGVQFLPGGNVTLQDVLEMVSKNPLESLPVKLGWKNTSAQR